MIADPAPPTLCPCCGTALRAMTRVYCGDWSYDPYGAVFYRCRPIAFSPQITSLIGVLMSATPLGRVVSYAAIAGFIGTDSKMSPANYIGIGLMPKLRAMWGEFFPGHPLPIETVRGIGLRWCGASMDADFPEAPNVLEQKPQFRGRDYIRI